MFRSGRSHSLWFCSAGGMEGVVGNGSSLLLATVVLGRRPFGYTRKGLAKKCSRLAAHWPVLPHTALNSLRSTTLCKTVRSSSTAPLSHKQFGKNIITGGNASHCCESCETITAETSTHSMCQFDSFSTTSRKKSLAA